MNNTALIFPGQGSQKLGMLAAEYAQYPIVKDLFHQASEVIGEDLWQICQSDEAKLNQTKYTQPILLTASVALWHIAQEKGLDQPIVMAGHSLGEYSALVCAESIAFTDAVNLVHQRGKFMQDAVPAGTGAMAAIIGLSDEEVVKVCQTASSKGVVEAVNFNSPGQVVIAGEKAAVDYANEQMKAAGAKRALPLSVSVPSHCALMKGAAEKLGALLQAIDVQVPAIPVIHNTDVETHANADAIREALVKQLYSPVRWVESVQKMANMGVTEFKECGPGKVLTNLNKRIVDGAEAQSLDGAFVG